MRHFLRWAPRILGLLFAGVLALFAMDVFGKGHGLWATVLALLMHLIPTGAVLLVVAFAWRWPLVGAVTFLVCAALYFVSIWGRNNWPGLLMIFAPAFITAVLFFADFLARRKR